MATPIDWPRWQRYRLTVEDCLREGFAPFKVPGGKGSSIGEAQRRLVADGTIVVGPKSASTLAKWLLVQMARAARGKPSEMPDWSLYKAGPRALAVPQATGPARRFLFTAAQNDCEIHHGFWSNLKAYAAHLDAEIVVAPFTYQLSIVRERARAEAGSPEERRLARERNPTWAGEIVPYLRKEPLDLGRLVFFCDMNILPTAKAPLSDLDTHSRGRWAVFPHAKVALKTVAAADDPPVICTTGAVTVDDYTDTKAGIKAVFHHVIGATLVEIDQAGAVFLRQINATADGSFQDLDAVVKSGRVTRGNRVEAITFGDIQSPFLDPAVALGTFGFDVGAWASAQTAPASMLDILRPRHGFIHDLCDNKPISHHDEKKTIERFRAYAAGDHAIEPHIAQAARFLAAIGRDWMQTVAIESNHDKWLDRWLDRADHRKDRDNARAYLRWELARHDAVQAGDETFSIWRHALREALPDGLDGVSFVREGGSYIICHEAGGIECGAHGHLGPNGARGAPSALARVSGKANFGDKHAPQIIDGAYFAGTSSLLRMGYNIGPSSWRHGHIVTYANGKRTLVIMHGEKWRA